MKKKIVEILVCTLLIAATVLPVAGNLNEGINGERDVTSIVNDFMQLSGKEAIPVSLNFNNEDFVLTYGSRSGGNDGNYPVPDYEFLKDPTPIMLSYYDYMPGSYASHPISMQTDYGDGYYLTFLGKSDPSSSVNRRQYYAYVNSSLDVQDWGLITTTYDEWQGYGSIGIHPATGDCIASWHEDTGPANVDRTAITFDDYDLAETPGAWQSPLIVSSSVPGEGNEYAWPYVYVGPSPLGSGFVRIYQLTNNAIENSAGFPCEDVRIMYTDIENVNGADLSDLLDLAEWNTVTVFTDWRPKSCRPFQAFAIDYNTPGKVAFIGNAAWIDGDQGDMPVDEGAFVWESLDYGENWSYDNLHSDGPGDALYQVNNPGFEGAPSELDVSASGFHNTALFDSEGNLHLTYMQSYGYSDPDGSYYFPYFLPQAEMVWDGSSFTFHEVPELPGLDTLSGHTVPWKTVGDTTYLYSVITWSTYPSSGAGLFHENTQKQAVNQENDWMLQMWADGTYHQLGTDGDPQYEDYVEHPIIFISVSSDNGRNWSDPIELTDVNSELFDFSEQITVYPYVGDQIVDLGDDWGQVCIYYMDDNTYGSNVHGTGANTGGNITYTSLKIKFPDPDGLFANANGPYHGDIDEETEFFGSARGGEPSYTDWYWEFGDGHNSTLQNPTHTYTTIDVFTVTLMVTDSGGNSSVDTTTATVIQPDIISPETTCTLDGEMDGDDYISYVEVTLEATDENSGVDYTMYKLDDGDWQTYSDPFVVTEDTNHTVSFYSVDNEGNEEDEKSCAFTIIFFEIAVEGGLGVKATFTNIGVEDLTDVEWSITFEGGFIISGDDNGTIDEFSSGWDVIKTVIPLGFGSTEITVTVGNAEKTVSAFVFLIFVLGVQ